MISRFLTFSILFSLTLAFVAAFFLQPRDAGALFMGTVWSCLNLFLIEQIARNYLTNKTSSGWKWLLLIKFPLLYVLGFFILAFNPLYSAAGLPLSTIGLLMAAVWTSIFKERSC